MARQQLERERDIAETSMEQHVDAAHGGNRDARKSSRTESWPAGQGLGAIAYVTLAMLYFSYLFASFSGTVPSLPESLRALLTALVCAIAALLLGMVLRQRLDARRAREGRDLAELTPNLLAERKARREALLREQGIDS